MFQNTIICFFVIVGCVFSLLPKTATRVPVITRSFQVAGGQRWANEFQGLDCTILGPVEAFYHLGDTDSAESGDYVDDYDLRKKRDFNLNVGKALEVIRRELPMVFAVSNLDFSIFSNSITVNDGKNSIGMTKSLYTAAVKSLRMASAISSMYPSMNVKKIEYLEDSRTIQCLVDVVLPDSVRVDGQAVWEGMFYFGLDPAGLINSHIFDRKISNFRPQGPVMAAAG